MQDNELFELCREVYEKTDLAGDQIWPDGRLATPLYTSDYLLEKLPQFIRFDGFEISRLEVCPAGYGKEYKTPNYTPKRPYVAEWCAGYHTKHGEIIKLGVSDTPRKVLLKLVIALDDAGVKL